MKVNWTCQHRHYWISNSCSINFGIQFLHGLIPYPHDQDILPGGDRDNILIHMQKDINPHMPALTVFRKKLTEFFEPGCHISNLAKAVDQVL